MDIEIRKVPERANDNAPNPEKGYRLFLRSFDTLEGVVDDIEVIKEKNIDEPFTKIVGNDVHVGGSGLTYKENVLEIHVPENKR